MSSPTHFYDTLSTLADTIDQRSDPEPLIFSRCVTDVFEESYPTVSLSQTVSEGVDAATDDLGPPERFELERYSIDSQGEKYTITVEAQYEDMLPYTYQRPTTQQPPGPQDYGPVLVTYQLRGEAFPAASHVHADVFAFRGTMDEFGVSDESSTE